MSTTIDNRVVDEAMEAYVDWLQQSVAVQDAYDHWARAPRDATAAAFLEDRAALDREEGLSMAYACLVGEPAACALPARRSCSPVARASAPLRPGCSGP